MNTDTSKLQHFPLEQAFLCADLDCRSVGNSSCICPACGNCNLLSLARIFSGFQNHEDPKSTQIEVLP